MSTACPACRSSRTTHAFRVGDCSLRTLPDEFDYRRCEACGSVFADPAPDEQTLATAYGSAYGNYQGQRGLVERLAEPLLRREAAWVVARAAGAAGHPALEIGCGTGRFLERLQATGWSGPITGVEYSPDVARETARRTGFDVVPGTAEDTGFGRAPYGVIVLRHVIEHLRDPHAVLRRCAEALHPDGVLYVATPDARALAAKAFGRRWWGYEVPRHLVVFASPALVSAAREAGLQPVAERWAFAPEMWNASLYLALDRGRGLGWTRRATSLLNPLVTGPAFVAAGAEVALRRSTMYGVLLRREALT